MQVVLGSRAKLRVLKYRNNVTSQYRKIFANIVKTSQKTKGYEAEQGLFQPGRPVFSPNHCSL